MRTTYLNLALLFLFGTLLIYLIQDAGYWINRSQAYDFRDYVDAQIERNGGLTSETQKIIQNYDNAHYGGRYVVVSDSGNSVFPYGSEVNYHIIVPQNLTLVQINLQSTMLKGTSVSLIRGN
jgi:hypothetical protein